MHAVCTVNGLYPRATFASLHLGDALHHVPALLHIALSGLLFPQSTGLLALFPQNISYGIGHRRRQQAGVRDHLVFIGLSEKLLFRRGQCQIICLGIAKIDRKKSKVPDFAVGFLFFCFFGILWLFRLSVQIFQADQSVWNKKPQSSCICSTTRFINVV